MRGLPTLATGLVLAGVVLWFLLDAEGSRETVDADAVAPDGGSAVVVDAPSVLAAPLAAERLEAPLDATATNDETAAGSSSESEMEPRTCLVRVVDDREESPIAGASVRSLDSSQPFEGETDDAGTVEVTLPPDARSLHLRVDAESRASTERNFSVTDEMTITLRRLGPLTGRILDADTDRPIVGARVAFRNPSCGACDPRVAESDEAGRYTLDVAPAKDGSLALSAAADDHAKQTQALMLDLGDDSWTHDLRLERGTRLAGSVYDMVDGSPLSGVQLGRSAIAGLTPITDENGRFDVHWLPSPSGSLGLRLRKQGYCQLSALIALERAADPSPLRLPMVPSARVTGRVTAEDGTGIAGAALHGAKDYASRADHPPSPLDTLPRGWSIRDEEQVTFTHTDEDGYYAFEQGLTPWRARLAVWVQAEGFENVHIGLPVLEPGQVFQQDVILSRKAMTAMISGTVTLNGAHLQSTVTWQGPTLAGETATFMRSQYMLEVEPGPIVLTVTPTDRTGQTSYDPLAEVTLDVAPGQSLAHHFTLETVSRPIRGRVQWDDGRAASDLNVSAQQVARVETTTDAEGRFTLDVPDLGHPYRINVWSGASGATLESVRPGTSGVELVLKSIGTLALRTVDATTGDALERPEIAWRAADGSDYWRSVPVFAGSIVRMLPDGTIEVDLPRGAYDLAIGKTGFGYPVTFEEVSVRAAETTERTFALQRVDPVTFVADTARSRDVWIEVTTEDERLAAFLEIWENHTLSPPGFLRFDDNARAFVQGLPEGDYRLEASKGVVTPATFVVGPDRSSPIELVWEEDR